jgi:hypothetical protein
MHEPALKKALKGKILKYILISIIAMSLSPSPLKAAITATLTRNPIYLNESTDLIIDLDSSGEEALRFPLHTNSYDVVARQSSSNITIINNKFIQTKQLIYTLRFRKAGIFTLPVKSNTSSDPKALLQIKVLETDQQSNAANNNSNPLRGQGMSSQLRGTGQETPFAIISASKDNPFLNEQIIFKLKIYHKGTLRQIQLPDFDLSNFIHKRGEKSKEYTENFNGEDYFIYELPYTLYPAKAGQLSIPARAILVSVLKENDANFDPFDPFANFNSNFSTETEKSLKTNDLTINVKALPLPIPSGFKGYIGNLKLNHRLAQDSAINGEPLSIFTEISGDGNPNNLNLKDLFLKSSDYKIYQDKSKKQSFPLSGKEQFRITMTSALIPNSQNSSLNLVSNPFIILNPETGKYETILAKEFTIKIQEKDPNSNSSIEEKIPPAKEETNNKFVNKLSKNKQPKKLSHIRDTSVQSYSHTLSSPNLLIRFIKDSFLNLYLLALLIILNLIGYSSSILSIIRKFAARKHYEKFPFKEYEKFILKSTSVSDISNKIKSLYSQIELEQNIDNKVPALDPKLFEEFNRFIENTDRINYGIKENLDTELISSDLKERALKILKGLKRLYE